MTKHGSWTGLGPEIDRNVRARLARNESIEQIAEAVGVATGYVRAIATEEEGDDAPPHDRPRAAPPPAEPGTALSRVACIVAGEDIGARECIARQCEQKCFCPKASFAINAIAPTVLPGTRLEDELGRCKAVARTVLMRPDGERHLGPALVALRGGKIEPPPLVSPVPLPAPPKREDKKPLITARPEPEPSAAEVAAAVLAQRKPNWNDFRTLKEKQRAETKSEPPRPPAICKVEGCRTALRVNNTTGFCQRCRQKVTSRERALLVPKIARVAGNAGEALAAGAAAEFLKQPQPATAPVKEEVMAQRTCIGAKGKPCPGKRLLRSSSVGDRCKHCNDQESLNPCERCGRLVSNAKICGRHTNAAPPAPTVAVSKPAPARRSAPRQPASNCSTHVCAPPHDECCTKCHRPDAARHVVLQAPAAAAVPSVGEPDEFERMRRVLADVRALPTRARKYVFELINEELAAQLALPVPGQGA